MAKRSADNQIAEFIASAVGLGAADIRIFRAVVNYIDDATVVAAARAVAEIALCAWSGIPTVAPDVMLYVMTACPEMRLADVDAEVRRVTKALVELGAVRRVGRGNKARLDVNTERPSRELSAALIAFELRRAHRSETLVPYFTKNSIALTLLGLKDGRSECAIDSACGGALRKDYIMGTERVIVPYELVSSVRNQESRGL